MAYRLADLTLPHCNWPQNVELETDSRLDEYEPDPTVAKSSLPSTLLPYLQKTRLGTIDQPLDIAHAKDKRELYQRLYGFRRTRVYHSQYNNVTRVGCMSNALYVPHNLSAHKGSSPNISSQPHDGNQILADSTWLFRNDDRQLDYNPFVPLSNLNCVLPHQYAPEWSTPPHSLNQRHSALHRGLDWSTLFRDTLDPFHIDPTFLQETLLDDAKCAYGNAISDPLFGCTAESFIYQPPSGDETVPALPQRWVAAAMGHRNHELHVFPIEEYWDRPYPTPTPLYTSPQIPFVSTFKQSPEWSRAHLTFSAPIRQVTAQSTAFRRTGRLQDVYMAKDVIAVRTPASVTLCQLRAHDRLAPGLDDTDCHRTDDTKPSIFLEVSASLNFSSEPLHVAFNPYYAQEMVVASRDQQIVLWDVEEVVGVHASQDPLVSNKYYNHDWLTCDYGSNPRTFWVADSLSCYTLDFRVPQEASKEYLYKIPGYNAHPDGGVGATLAVFPPLKPLATWRSFDAGVGGTINDMPHKLLNPRYEHRITALTRCAVNDFKAFVATHESILGLDARMPHRPVLWINHHHSRDPPRYLSSWRVGGVEFGSLEMGPRHITKDTRDTFPANRPGRTHSSDRSTNSRHTSKARLFAAGFREGWIDSYEYEKLFQIGEQESAQFANQDGWGNLDSTATIMVSPQPVVRNDDDLEVNTNDNNPVPPSAPFTASDELSAMATSGSTSTLLLYNTLVDHGRYEDPPVPQEADGTPLTDTLNYMYYLTHHITTSSGNAEGGLMDEAKGKYNPDRFKDFSGSLPSSVSLNRQETEWVNGANAYRRRCASTYYNPADNNHPEGRQSGTSVTGSYLSTSIPPVTPMQFPWSVTDYMNGVTPYHHHPAAAVGSWVGPLPARSYDNLTEPRTRRYPPLGAVVIEPEWDLSRFAQSQHNKRSGEHGNPPSRTVRSLAPRFHIFQFVKNGSIYHQVYGSKNTSTTEHRCALCQCHRRKTPNVLSGRCCTVCDLTVRPMKSLATSLARDPSVLDIERCPTVKSLRRYNHNLNILADRRNLQNGWLFQQGRPFTLALTLGDQVVHQELSDFSMVTLTPVYDYLVRQMQDMLLHQKVRYQGLSQMYNAMSDPDEKMKPIPKKSKAHRQDSIIHLMRQPVQSDRSLWVERIKSRVLASTVPLTLDEVCSGEDSTKVLAQLLGSFTQLDLTPVRTVVVPWRFSDNQCFYPSGNIQSCWGQIREFILNSIRMNEGVGRYGAVLMEPLGKSPSTSKSKAEADLSKLLDNPSLKTLVDLIVTRILMAVIVLLPPGANADYMAQLDRENNATSVSPMMPPSDFVLSPLQGEIPSSVVTHVDDKKSRLVTLDHQPLTISNGVGYLHCSHLGFRRIPISQGTAVLSERWQPSWAKDLPKRYQIVFSPRVFVSMAAHIEGWDRGTWYAPAFDKTQPLDTKPLQLDPSIYNPANRRRRNVLLRWFPPVSLTGNGPWVRHPLASECPSLADMSPNNPTHQRTLTVPSRFTRSQLNADLSRASGNEDLVRRANRLKMYRDTSLTLRQQLQTVEFARSLRRHPDLNTGSSTTLMLISTPLTGYQPKSTATFRRTKGHGKTTQPPEIVSAIQAPPPVTFESIPIVVTSHKPGSAVVEKPGDVGIGMIAGSSKLKKRKRVRDTGEPIPKSDTKRARVDNVTVPAVAQPVSSNTAKPTTRLPHILLRDERRKKVKRRRTQGF
ncbi:hypothetical protein IWQ61_003843 [Dispira simplex]|nr:hypothetical protein IWQ61_003843 [Dispira simplex]